MHKIRKHEDNAASAQDDYVTCLHGLQNQPIEVTITSKENRGLSGKRSQFKRIRSTCICFLHEVCISYEK